MRDSSTAFLDPLYGEIGLPEKLSRLVWSPMMQRLRFVRLSNIESLDFSGIANISRWEHSLGTAYLASRACLRLGLGERESLIFCAAALIHDAGITPFGHLLEEALAYSGVPFDHETIWGRLLEGDGNLLGGVGAQVFEGRTSGLKEWARSVFGRTAETSLAEIVAMVAGKGRLARLIAGSLDVDNLDNVPRMLYHMGFPEFRDSGIHVVRALLPEHSGISQEVGIRASEIHRVVDWLKGRSALYARLMPAPRDLAAKIMLLSASLDAIESRDLSPEDAWRFCDEDLVRTLKSKEGSEKSAVVRLRLGELWNVLGPLWVCGETPSLHSLRQQTLKLEARLKRELFSYRIKDKRFRKIRIRTETGESVVVGEDSRHWMLAIGSPERRAFSRQEADEVSDWVTQELAGRILRDKDSDDSAGVRDLFGAS